MEKKKICTKICTWSNVIIPTNQAIHICSPDFYLSVLPFPNLLYFSCFSVLFANYSKFSSIQNISVKNTITACGKTALHKVILEQYKS